jgi:hypothetical protein
MFGLEVDGGIVVAIIIQSSECPHSSDVFSGRLKVWDIILFVDAGFTQKLGP